MATKILIVLFVLGITVPQPLFADGKKENAIGGMGWAYFDQNEFNAFPDYCKARFYPQKSAIYQNWLKKFGGDFIHIHHY